MSWKKNFRPVNSVLPVAQRTVDSMAAYSPTSKYKNFLPETYVGNSDRIQRYQTLEQMGYDHEISAALDTLADFGTESDPVSKLPLVLKFNDDPTPSEVLILEKSLNQWARINKINRRLWSMFRSVLVYGDQFYLRDPETFILYWIDPAKVEKVIVNESDGKKIESYFVKDIDLNMKSLVGTNQLNKLSNTAFGSNSIIFSPPMQGNMNYASGGFGSAGSANYQDGGAVAIDAEHVLQLSLTDGMNSSWPFGLSILEQIYKVYKQKELLEDAILIYRIHRAPERRVFFIDVGTMPPNKAQQYLERVKYEVQQKRVPSRSGGGCFAMDTEVPLMDGRTLTIAKLEDEFKSGKENWAYSCNPITGKMVPGLISWAGVTQKSADVLKLTLDNGEEIICTPEHKFPIIGKGFVEAKDIAVNDDSLIRYNEGTHKQEVDTYHKITLIENLDDKIEVGTLTIDGDEKHHNYHTFAIKQGVYTKNSSVADSTYNPMSMLEDYYFAVTSEGRGSKVEVLPGGENLGDIDDLRYFNNKMLRALGVPSSYLPTGPEDGTASVSDGRVGAAFIQEFRFSKVVSRYQQQIIEPLDKEFKLFLKFRGITIDSSLFDIEFTPPQSFSEYRQLELDSARVNLFTALTDIPYVSKRFVLKTYLKWSEEQLAENEHMWKEERSRLTKSFAPDTGSAGTGAAGLSDVGITSSGIDNMSHGFDEGGDDTGAGGDTATDTEVDSFGED